MIAQAQREAAVASKLVEPFDQQAARAWLPCPAHSGSRIGASSAYCSRAASLLCCEHEAQHQRVAEAVRQMMKPAERICQRVDARDGRIRKGQPGEMRAKQHRRAGFEIARLVDRRQQIARQQSERFAGQRIRSGFLSRAEV